MTTGDPAGHPGRLDKQRLRQAVTARRHARPSSVRLAADAARDTLVLESLPVSVRVVAAYASAGDEPGTLPLVHELHRRGIQVLLPVLRRPGPGGLARPDWAAYQGPETLRPGRYGIAQTTGEALGARGLAAADLVLLPGLSGTVDGVRLGTGGGWYDRALLHASPHAPRWLLLHDDEVATHLPLDPWDQSVTALVTETRWVACTAPVQARRHAGA